MIHKTPLSRLTPLLYRRDPANECMGMYEQKDISLDIIYECLSTPPVLSRGTVYTALMSPADDEFKTTIRNQVEF